MKCLIHVLGGVLFLGTSLFAGASFRSEMIGMSSLWRDKGRTEINGGLLWIPEIHISHPGFINVDFLVSSRFSGSWDSYDKEYSDADLYRAWMRIAGNTWDLRGGMQKITFGPARLFRALMWFDELNPTDLLRLTSGVWGLRGRVFFSNNLNVWGWTLYGNTALKGREFYPTQDKTLEYGGRMQFPVALGEWGVSVHSRKLNLTPDVVPAVYISEQYSGDSREFRLGFDGQWDIGAGVWFESVIYHTMNHPTLPWTHTNVIGLDYTFSLGSGLYILGEYGFTNTFDDDLINILSTDMWGLMMNYPLSFFSSVSGIFMWLPDNNLISAAASWQYTAGNFTYYIQYLQMFTQDNLQNQNVGTFHVPYDTHIKGMISWTISK